MFSAHPDLVVNPCFERLWSRGCDLKLGPYLVKLAHLVNLSRIWSESWPSSETCETFLHKYERSDKVGEKVMKGAPAQLWYNWYEVPSPPPLPPPKPNKLGGEYGVEGGVMKCVKVSLTTTSKNKSNFDDNVGERLVSISFICWHFWWTLNLSKNAHQCECISKEFFYMPNHSYQDSFLFLNKIKLSSPKNSCQCHIDHLQV